MTAPTAPGPADPLARAWQAIADAMSDVDGKPFQADALTAQLAKRGLVLVDAARYDKTMATLQFVGSALEPFAAKFEAFEASYRKRGGHPDTFGDKHPSFDVSAHELAFGVWREIRDAVAKCHINGGNQNEMPNQH